MDPTDLGVSDVQLTWVVNDVALGPLRQEHGYAVWIKMPGGTVLLDTGGSGDVLVGNLAALGLNPADLDAVVVSHAHDDHTGGLSDLLPLLRPGTPLYAHPTLFRRRYSTSSGKMVDRGIPVQEEVLSARMDLRLSAAPTLVVPGVWVSGEISERPELEGRSAHHWVYEGSAFRPDPYEDDVSVVIEVGPGDYFLLCGCCHAGLLNTLKTVDSRWHGRWIGIGGGVHMVGADPVQIAATIAALRELEGLDALWLGHCSGDAFIAACDALGLGDGLYVGAAGQRLTISHGQYHLDDVTVAPRGVA